jgi:hypothetical protein
MAQLKKWICKLTGEEGQFVKSHILPQAVTRLSNDGSKYIETGIGHGFKKRPSSWYDSELVTRSGEDILAEIDSSGINELRRHKLIWSGFNENSLISADMKFVDKDIPFCRYIKFEQPKTVSLFFQSLVWRSAASNLKEFAEIKLENNIINDLKSRILKRDPGSLLDYPIQFYQITSKGPAHNRTPLLYKNEPVNANNLDWGCRTFIRFYFDGLVANFIIPEESTVPSEYYNLCLRENDDTFIVANKFDDSRAKRDLTHVILNSDHERNKNHKPKLK